MGYKEGSSRYNISFMAPEEMVHAESMAKIIDRFVELCDFQELGFNQTTPTMTGRPAYPPKQKRRAKYGQQCDRHNKKHIGL